MSSLLPIFLDLKDKPVLVIGGGLVALEKLEKLVATGAQLVVIAEHFHPQTLSLLLVHNVRYIQRAFSPEDLHGQFLVISAVNEANRHAAIAHEARSRGILINAVDAPSASDFYFAAQISRGPLQLAISTQGLFPGVARAIRIWLETLLPAEIETELNDLVDIRAHLKQLIPDPVHRMRDLKAQLQVWTSQYPFKRTGESS
jgi:siroheme synthase-like protein